jgi:hypothetical protein
MKAKQQSCAILPTANGYSNTLASIYHAISAYGFFHSALKVFHEMFLAKVLPKIALCDYGLRTAFRADHS